MNTAIKVSLFVVIGSIAVYVIYKIVSPAIKPNKEDNEHKKYDAESFPLKKGMYGEKTRKIRAVMGLTPSDIFDAELENAIYSKFKVKEIRETDYNYWANMPYITPNI